MSTENPQTIAEFRRWLQHEADAHAPIDPDWAVFEGVGERLDRIIKGNAGFGIIERIQEDVRLSSDRLGSDPVGRYTQAIRREVGE